MSDAESAVAELQEGLAGRYTIEAEIGRGGMAIVYRAWDVRHERVVAIKVLRPELAHVLGAERFGREIKIELRLQHPNILPVHESGDIHGTLYYVMPFVDGESLRARLTREGPLPVDDAVRITREVGDALFYAHTHGLVHRDVKPENVLLSSGHALVADFGIAHTVSEAAGERLTGTGLAIGTPAYMSPEQGSGTRGVDPRSDVYSLGCVLYEMLVGEPPFAGRTAQAVIARHLQERPPSIEVVRPTVPPHLIAAVEKALAKVPADRFATAAEFVSALTEPRSSRAPAAPWRSWRAGAAVAVLAGALVVTAVLGRRSWMPPAAPLDPNKIVVFPLTTRGGLDPHAGLDVATMIAQALEHTEPLKFIDAWPYLGERERAAIENLTADQARAIALGRRARYYLDGVVRSGQDSITVMVRLHDADADSLIVQETAGASVGTVWPYQLGLSAIRAALPALLEPQRAFAFEAVSGRAPAAVVLFAQGERAYRNSDFGRALDLYQRAVLADSSIAFAALKAAQAASWLNRLDDAERLVAVALSHDSLLPPRHAQLARGLEGYVTGKADSAVAAVRRALALDPEWGEAQMALGEIYFHLVPSEPGAADSVARAAFEATAALDSGFAPPLIHLAELSIADGDLERGAALIRRLAAFDLDTMMVRHLDLMTSCARTGAPDGGWARAAELRPLFVFRAARALVVGERWLPCAEAGFRALLKPSVPATFHWGAVLGLHAVLALEGRDRELVALVDSTIAAGVRMGQALYLVDAPAGSAVQAQAQQVARSIQGAFGADYERLERPSTLWLLGAWHAYRGDTTSLALLAGRLSRLAESTGEPATERFGNALAAHLALARGDTSGAISRLRAVHPTARRDSIQWGIWDAHPVERLLLARLLMAQQRFEEALDVASGLDHPAPIAYLPFRRASLELRESAARALGRSSLAAQYAQRLRHLTGARHSADGR